MIFLPHYKHQKRGTVLMPSKDYYSFLNLTAKASASEIRRAYRKLALECHPDHHPDDRKAEERFKRINEAYSVLGDAQKRRDYDLGNDPHTGNPGDDIRMGRKERRARQGNRATTPKDFAQNTILGVRVGQIVDFVLTPEEARHGAERFVLVTVGKRREGYRVKIPGGLAQGAQFKAILGRDETRYILVKTRITGSAHYDRKE
jgi:curved DNA-binding protein CbpA